MSVQLPPLFSGVVYLENSAAELPDTSPAMSRTANAIASRGVALPDTREGNVERDAQLRTRSIRLPGVRRLGAPNANGIKLPSENTSLSHRFASGFAGLMSPVLNVLGNVLPYAGTALRVIRLIGDLTNRDERKFEFPKPAYGTNFGTVSCICEGKAIEFQFDLTLSEEHRSTATPFSHPIETGTEITDHVMTEGKTITCEFLETNFSVRRRNAGAASDHADIFYESGMAAANAYIEHHAEDAYLQMEEIQRKKCICSFQSSIAKYRNLVIAELSSARDAESGSGMKIYVVFQEIQIAEAEEFIVDILLNLHTRDVNSSIVGDTRNTGAAPVGAL
jgi:hypothetical protein